MCGKSELIATHHLKGGQYDVKGNEYDSKRIANIIRRYQELRSIAEITAVQYRQISNGGGFAHGKDDIVCVLADIDQGVVILSSRQLTVFELLKRGYQVEEIGKMLGIRPVTVKFHIQQVVFRLAAYLNTPHSRERGEKK
ncbi:LuxR C-terminal-related transcriptional regulator [Sporomusa sp.]|uniref:LuxR C-terminal-related transcriptional regulator n=1 Tax=Sporomusa sp. TaxID=2078658 RepID=UPI002B652F5A|nr:LuxR C-terminal-related transcriptional regulator [Sporomusa sp.]HWR44942.1 LuxR C-terminal-related transcriptional regulator [Sporomusa sp.]